MVSRRAYSSMWCFVLVLVVVGAAIADTAKPSTDKVSDILKKEGQFVFTDASSYFRFNKDGTFDSGPLKVSGRTIRGKWKAEGDYSYVVEGDWGWLNGVSPKVDRRKLTLYVFPPLSEQTMDPEQLEFIPKKSKTAIKIHKCYVVIDEIIKTK